MPARPCRHAVGGRWFVDETYVKVAGVWRYVYRAVEQHGQVIDVLVSTRRDIPAARRFFTMMIAAHGVPEEIVTDRAAALANVIEELAPQALHAVGRRWFVDETYVKVAGVWRFVYRAIDGYGQVIDVYVSTRRHIPAARRFFTNVIDAHGEPEEVVTDRAAALANVIDELVPQAMHTTVKHANNRVECDHGRLKARLRPMRGLKTDRTASVIISGHAFIQNVRRGHYELGADARHRHLRCAAAFDELALAI